MTGTPTPRAARDSARSWRRGGVGLIILCLLVYIPGLWTIPPVDRDESRFAQASRQMLESGTLEGWVVPRVQDKPRLNKPPLIYWLQAASAAALGDAPGQWSWLDNGSENIWVYRVPSVLCAIATVLLTWRLGLGMFDPRAAWLAAALLAICPMVVWDAHQARADQLLLATTTATMLALWRIWSHARKHAADEALRVRGSSVARRSVAWALAFWLFLALGVMTKGPITPMIAALTCLALSLVARDFRWLLNLRPFLGVVIVAAVVAPWVILVGDEVGWSNYLRIIYDETIGRSAGAKEGHWGPPGYHIVLLGLLFWPGSLLTAAAIGRAWRRGLRSQNRDPQPAASRRIRRAWDSLRDARPSRPAELFLLAWMLPSWIVFELISTKLPHYTMPLYPAVALISARALFGVRQMFLPALSGTQRRDLREFLAARDIKCPRCGYNLRGLTFPACPECRLDIRVKHGRLAAGALYDRGMRAGTFMWFLFGVAITIAAPFTIAAINMVWTDRPPLGISALTRTVLPVILIALIVTFLGFVLLGAARRSLRRDRFLKGTFYAMTAAAFALATTLGVLLPRIPQPWISHRVVNVMRERRWTPDIPTAAFRYTEDSLVFLTRGRITLLHSNEDRVAWMNNNHERAILICPSTNTISHPYPHGVTFLESIKGFNYSTGQRMTVAVGELRK